MATPDETHVIPGQIQEQNPDQHESPTYDIKPIIQPYLLFLKYNKIDELYGQYYKIFKYIIRNAKNYETDYATKLEVIINSNDVIIEKISDTINNINLINDSTNLITVKKYFVDLKDIENNIITNIKDLIIKPIERNKTLKKLEEETSDEERLQKETVQAIKKMKEGSSKGPFMKRISFDDIDILIKSYNILTEVQNSHKITSSINNVFKYHSHLLNNENHEHTKYIITSLVINSIINNLFHNFKMIKVINEIHITNDKTKLLQIINSPAIVNKDIIPFLEKNLKTLLCDDNVDKNYKKIIISNYFHNLKKQYITKNPNSEKKSDSDIPDIPDIPDIIKTKHIINHIHKERVNSESIITPSTTYPNNLPFYIKQIISKTKNMHKKFTTFLNSKSDIEYAHKYIVEQHVEAAKASKLYTDGSRPPSPSTSRPNTPRSTTSRTGQEKLDTNALVAETIQKELGVHLEAAKKHPGAKLQPQRRHDDKYPSINTRSVVPEIEATHNILIKTEFYKLLGYFYYKYNDIEQPEYEQLNDDDDDDKFLTSIKGIEDYEDQITNFYNILFNYVYFLIMINDTFRKKIITEPKPVSELLKEYINIKKDMNMNMNMNTIKEMIKKWYIEYNNTLDKIKNSCDIDEKLLYNYHTSLYSIFFNTFLFLKFCHMNIYKIFSRGLYEYFRADIGFNNIVYMYYPLYKESKLDLHNKNPNLHTVSNLGLNTNYIDDLNKKKLENYYISASLSINNIFSFSELLPKEKNENYDFFEILKNIKQIKYQNRKDENIKNIKYLNEPFFLDLDNDKQDIYELYYDNNTTKYFNLEELEFKILNSKD